jgi:hypothetical protein
MVAGLPQIFLSLSQEYLVVHLIALKLYLRGCYPGSPFLFPTHYLPAALLEKPGFNRGQEAAHLLDQPA